MGDFLEVALGMLNWSPQSFWQSTPFEVRIASDGWLKANRPVAVGSCMPRAVFEQLKKQFPDTMEPQNE